MNQWRDREVGFEPNPGGVAVMTPPGKAGADYYVGLDLGQSQDYSALVIAEKHVTPPEAMYDIRHLQRFPLGTAYPTIVTEVSQMLAALRTPADARSQQPEIQLVLDYTGVGRPLFDLFQQAGLDPIAITIHGGDHVRRDGREYGVPKRDLVGVLQVLLQSQRLRVAEALPEAQTLVQELLNFKVTIDPRTAHDSYSAWRENIHDDLVLATAIAVWYAERHTPPPIVSPPDLWRPARWRDD